jgi:signal transduction histidine kinase/CheY-like chemotaxis protein
MTMLSAADLAGLSLSADAARDSRIVEATKAKHAVLSAIPASTREQRLALAVVVGSIAAFAVTVPLAQKQLMPVAAFIPAYEAALIIIDLITAVLLLGQFVQLRTRALLVLAAGYLFDAAITIPHALTFPGLFAPTGLLGAGPQSTAWLYMFWHGGFPLFVIAYALLQGKADGATSVSRSHRAGRMEPMCAFLAVAGIACAITLLTTAGQDFLPNIMHGHNYTPAMKFVVGTVWMSSLMAFVVLWKRRSSSALDLWLMVVMCAWMCDIALSAVLNHGRFDVGFYTGRIYGLMAASFVLIVLILETGGLYGRLAKATVKLEHRAMKLEKDMYHTVTEQKQTQAQLRQAQKMEAIGNLTGGMAHDFNNLLGVVIGNLDILCERKKNDAEVQELGNDALEAALRGADLTRRLLAFARRQPLQPQRVDLNQLIEGITKLLSRTLGENIEVALDLDPRLWPVVADPAQLEASLTNLATNARDAMPNGGKLIVATRNSHLDSDYAAQHQEVVAGDYAMIEVSDNGSGIPSEMLGRIFDPFFTTKEQGKGTGLGLSMVYGFMKQSGGHINVYSEPGFGTTFRLYIPRAQDSSVRSTEPATKEIAAGSGETVLVVEDNASLRRVAERQLKELGYRVLEADNAKSALAILKREQVDVLFTDVVMPGGTTGIELAEKAQAQWPKLRVMLVSGFPDVRLGENGITPVATRLLNKPYRKQELAVALRETLENNKTTT